MNKLKLVDNTMGAHYLDSMIHFNQNDLSWYEVETKRRAFSNEYYPDIVDFCIKGSERVFRVRLDDFLDSIKYDF